MSSHNNKIFVLLPDGVGLRNFVLSDFADLGTARGHEIIYWNLTPFAIKDLGKDEIKINGRALYWKTTILSRARKRIELILAERKLDDPVYATYNFPQRYSDIKNAFKSLYVDYLVSRHASENGLFKIRQEIKSVERKTEKYNEAVAQLKKNMPALVFCTNQRPTQAIAPILAAQDLSIPTATFIFSWDNLPKATMVLETDYYFVWSMLMRDELLRYYPYINEDQIIISGTPQFENHYNPRLLKSRTTFFKHWGLDINKEYICFTGDDETTSPLDEEYLEDLAKAVERLNNKGAQLGIIFRRVPTYFGPRYDHVLKKYEHLIKPIAPLWKSFNDSWDQILPTKADGQLLVNTAVHSLMVVSIGSSTAFDFAIHGTPCMYLNYEQPQLKKGIRNIGQNYKYVHFRSMPSEDTVVWARTKDEVYDGIKAILNKEINPVPDTQKWLGLINNPIAPEKASQRIWEGIEQILKIY